MYTLNLKRICTTHGMTLTELARRTSIPQPSLSRYGTGGCDITLRQLSRIALVLGVGIEELVDDGAFTRSHKREIRRIEEAAPAQDKAWVGHVMSGLRRHYRKVRG